MLTDIIVKKDIPTSVFSEEVERRIANGWQALQSRDPRVYNGTLLRALHDVDHSTSSISVTPDIGYREVVGLRCHKDFLDWVPAHEQFQVLSAIAFVETADGAILLKERSTGDWEHSLELLGGFITAKNIPETVEKYIHHRVADDLAVDPQKIDSVERVGHVDFKSICESMFVFKTTLTVPFEDLKQTPTQFLKIPEEYAPAMHGSFFKLPLHSPSRTVLERFLSAITTR